MRIMKPSEEKGGGGVNIESVIIDVPYTGWTNNEATGRYERTIDLTQSFQNIGDNDILVATVSYDTSTLDPSGWTGYKDITPYLIIDDTRRRYPNYLFLAAQSDPAALSSGATYFTLRLLLFRRHFQDCVPLFLCQPEAPKQRCSFLQPPL